MSQAQQQSKSSFVPYFRSIVFKISALTATCYIEAVRAGEHGKGFVVVSSEIRKLADQSKQATERIADISGRAVA